MSKENNTQSREYPDRPIVAVGVVVFKEQHVLLIKRNKPPKSFMWSIPGGAQGLGEKLQETAKREVFEETGIKIKNVKLLDVVDFIERNEIGDIKFHYSLIDYAATYKEGSLIAGDDAMEARWVAMDELEHYNLWTKTTSIIQKAKLEMDVSG